MSIFLAQPLAIVRELFLFLHRFPRESASEIETTLHQLQIKPPDDVISQRPKGHNDVADGQSIWTTSL